MNHEIVDVVAGVIVSGDGRFLLGQRAPGTFYSGYWEFPGGKVEAGESPGEALCRELDEELGIAVEKFYPWLTRTHEYEHARVRLHFFEVTRWRGEIRDRVHSALTWVAPGGEVCTPMLPANGPILKALTLPRWMGITHVDRLGVEVQLAALDRALAAGLRLVQLRMTGMERFSIERARAAVSKPSVEREAATREVFDAEVVAHEFAREVLARRRVYDEDVVRLAHAAGALVVVNDDPEMARDLGADGLHLPAARLMACDARPDFVWVGASCHVRAELEHAAALGFDYALLGPVKATATHPGGEVLGWEGFSALAAGLPLPVFALGGLTMEDMETARRAGAHGIAAIRAAWGDAGAAPVPRTGKGSDDRRPTL
ncbi:MAG: thiamine phosphate synthase [Azoarcus sp.]|jgi:8-oxo-dGTP diphosphatase|nr:thiamine phosphate synthase [Azoarcus sp.]